MLSPCTIRRGMDDRLLSFITRGLVTILKKRSSCIWLTKPIYMNSLYTLTTSQSDQSNRLPSRRSTAQEPLCSYGSLAPVL